MKPYYAVPCRNFRHAQYLAAVLDRGMDGAMDVADAEHAALTAEIERLRSALATSKKENDALHGIGPVTFVSGGYVIYPGTARSGGVL